MSTAVISATSFETVWVGRSNTVDRWTSSDLVKAFGDRVYSIAKHITQNDDDAEDVLIETFLEVCSDLDRTQERDKLWIRLVTIAVREAFSNLRIRGEGVRLLDRVSDSCEELVVREVTVWGQDNQQQYPWDKTSCVLEQGLRSLDPMCRTVFVLRDMREFQSSTLQRS